MPRSPLPAHTAGGAAIEAAYAHCRALARAHYENFPVASLALPARLRGPVSAIYAFARTADDWADEGALQAHERLARLDAMAAQLDALRAGAVPDEPIFRALADTIDRHRLDTQPLYDLLAAFRMDVTKTRYADFGELMGYCGCSANPVGRLLLQLYETADERSIEMSDAVCSALQLINFFQDLSQDYHEKGRIYLPQDEMARFGVTEAHIGDARSDEAMRRLMDFQLDRAERLLGAGAPLGRVLPGRIGFELRLIIAGGARVLAALRASTNLFARPRLSTRDRLGSVWQATFGR
jgi:hydroxysqualene synthase